MAAMRVQYKNLGEVWREDKEFLAMCGFELPVARDLPHPMPEDYEVIFSSADAAAISNPILLTQDSVDDLVRTLLPQIEAVYCASLPSDLSVIVLPFHSYAARYRASAVSLAEQIGGTYDPSEEFLPPVTSFPHLKRIFVSEHIPYYDEHGNALPPVQWSQPMLEHMLLTALANTLFHYTRNEWGSAFTRSRAALSEAEFDTIYAVKNALTLHTLEVLIRNTMPSWGLYHVADKLNTIYEHPDGHTAYAAISAMIKVLPFAQVAMIDGVTIQDYCREDNTVHCPLTFYPQHPFHKQKYERFRMASS